MKEAKMRKCLKKAVSALVCFSVMASTIVGYAYRVDYAGGDADFNLSGKTDEAIAGQIVTLKVVNGGETVYTRQAETNASGEYTFTFKVLEGASGDVNIYVNAGEDVTPTPTLLYKSTATEVSDAISRVKSDICADTATDIKVLQMKGAVTANSVLAKYMNANNTYTDIPGFSNVYKKGLFLQALNDGADNAELYALMTESGMDGVLTGNTAETFAAYSESEKTAVLGNVETNIPSGESYAAGAVDADFAQALAEAVIINELSKTSIDSEKWSVLKNNSSYLSMPLSTYEGLSKFTDFKEELFENTITSISAMKEKAETIYARLNQTTPDGGTTTRGDRESVSVSSGLVTTPATPVTFGFNDLAGYDWAKDAILSLTADGIVNGKSTGIFAPGDNVTRAEFAKIIIGAFNLIDNSATANFADTPKSHWSYRYVASAANKDIVTGVSATSFNPDGKITRQDMATICYRVLKRMGVETSTAGKKEFADASLISDYAKEAVDVLSGLGIINGTDNGKFAPLDYATRAEAAKIIHSLRALD